VTNKLQKRLALGQAPVQFWCMKTILFFCISSALLTASTLLTGCTAGDESGTPQVQTSDNSSGEPAAALAVAHWVKGEPVDVSSGVHVVEFWATWCPPCLTSIPHLTELQEKFKDRGVNIIGVSDEELATVESFVKKMGDKMAYTVAIDAGATSKGYMGKYGVGGIPHAFVVKDGKVVWHGHPMDPMDKLDDAIEDALK
jgi:thiol-disulfide isomerase/thioredoxin